MKALIKPAFLLFALSFLFMQCTKEPVTIPGQCTIEYQNHTFNFVLAAWNVLGNYTDGITRQKIVLLAPSLKPANGGLQGSGHLIEITLLTQSDTFPSGTFPFSTNENAGVLFNAFLALDYQASVQLAQSVFVVNQGDVKVERHAAGIQLELRLVTTEQDSLKGTYVGSITTQNIPKIN